MKKEHLIPVLLVGLALAFIFVSIMVFLSNGKANWVKKKLRMGGILLSMTAILNGCHENEPFNPDGVTCYDPTPPVEILIENCENHEIKINLDQNNKIKGEIASWYEISGYSYKIFDSSKKEIAKGDIIPNDGKFNEHKERITIKLSKDIQEGEYWINFYPFNVRALSNNSHYSERFKLIISK